MKRLITSLLLVFCAAIAANAQCPLSGFSLTTQAEVDAFDNDFPDCHDLDVKMTIGSDDDSDITNLTPLSGLQTTTNGIEIKNNPLLSSLNGLNNISTIGVSLSISNNDGLTSLSGLGSLTSIGGNLSIDDNASMTTLNGIGTFPSLGGYLYIAFNPALTNITALNGITSVGDFVQINNNNSLGAINGLNSLGSVGTFFLISTNNAMTTVNGFNGLTSVGNVFSIAENPSLTDLNGFTSLATVGSDFIIDLNSALTNVDEFDPLATITGDLVLASNSNLSNCVADGICAYIAPAGVQAVIFGNAVGCQNEAQVEIACGVAPVELIFFKGKFENKEVVLTWQTASEQNNSFFEVEHSLNGKDFKMLGRVTGNGTTMTLSDYEFRHSTPSKGSNYYRLKQVDADRTFAYSNIVSVLVRDDSDVEIFPNPTTGTVTLRGGAQGERSVKVADFSGQVILEKDLTESSILDLSGQPNGIYFIEIQTENQKVVKRLIKE